VVRALGQAIFTETETWQEWRVNDLINYRHPHLWLGEKAKSGPPSTAHVKMGEPRVWTLLPVKHENLGVTSPRYLRGHGQRLEIRGKLELLGVGDFAVAHLICQFEGVLVHSAIVFAIEFHVSRASSGGDGKTASVVRPDLDH